MAVAKVFLKSNISSVVTAVPCLISFPDYSAHIFHFSYLTHSLSKCQKYTHVHSQSSSCLAGVYALTSSAACLDTFTTGQWTHHHLDHSVLCIVTSAVTLTPCHTSLSCPSKISITVFGFMLWHHLQPALTHLPLDNGLITTWITQCCALSPQPSLLLHAIPACHAHRRLASPYFRAEFQSTASAVPFRAPLWQRKNCPGRESNPQPRNSKTGTLSIRQRAKPAGKDSNNPGHSQNTLLQWKQVIKCVEHSNVELLTEAAFSWWWYQEKRL